MRLCIHSITLQLLSPHGSWYIFSWTFSYGLLVLWLLELDSCMTVEVRGWWQYFTISAEKLWSRANHLDPTGNGPSVRPQQGDGLLQFESSPNSTAYASLKINIPLADIAQYLFQQNSSPFCLLTSSFHTISLKKSLFFFNLRKIIKILHILANSNFAERKAENLSWCSTAVLWKISRNFKLKSSKLGKSGCWIQPSVIHQGVI